MLNRFQLTAVAAVLSLASVNAFAVNPGFYIGAQASYNTVDRGVFIRSYENFGGGIRLGYNFPTSNRVLLGVEFASNYLGKFERSSSDLFAGSALMALTYAADSQWDAFVKVGIARETIFEDRGDFYGDSDIAPTLGVGFAFNLSNHWDFNVQYTHIFGDSVAKVVVSQSNTAFTYDNVLVGFTYNFGPGKSQAPQVVIQAS